MLDIYQSSIFEFFFLTIQSFLKCEVKFIVIVTKRGKNTRTLSKFLPKFTRLT